MTDTDHCSLSSLILHQKLIEAAYWTLFFYIIKIKCILKNRVDFFLRDLVFNDLVVKETSPEKNMWWWEVKHVVWGIKTAAEARERNLQFRMKQ